MRAAAAFSACLLVLTGCAGLDEPDTSAGVPAAQSPAPATRPTSPDPAAIVRIPQPAAQSAPPIRARIQGLGSADVVPVGVTPQGEAEIPEDVAQLGWYRFGPAPGDGQGSVVLMGHRDSRGARGALYDLATVAPGSVIEVTDRAGATRRYAVASTTSIAKQVVPLADLFARTGPEQLVVISCGGAYDRSQGGYLDNVVVTALPV